MLQRALPDRVELECGPIDAVSLALYAASSGDHNPLHLDAAVARQAGFERPVVHGMLVMAHVARLFTSSFGITSLRTLSTRFVGVVLARDRLSIVGTLEAQDRATATYRVRAVNEKHQDVLSGVAVVEPGRPC